MLKILAKPLELIQSLFFLAFPMARGGPQKTAGTGETAGVWVGRGLLLAAVLGGLTALNQVEYLGLKGWISYGKIGRYWLPLFAFCLYAMTWMGWWLYRLLNMDVPALESDYPDIDQAWSQAVEALKRTDIGLDSTPLFLLLGGSSSGDEALFQSAAIKAQLKQVPKDPAAPLHVTANNDGIWVSCLGASVLGQQLLALGEGTDGSPEVSLESLAGPADPDPFKTVGLGGGETLRLEDFMASPEFKKAQDVLQGRPKSRKAVDVEKYTARLRYLCHLIARDRQGLCPINGVMVVLPVTASEPGTSIADIALASKLDLTDAFEVLRIRCPVLFLVSDLNKLRGFGDLVELLPSDQRNKRMGQRFPLAPELDSQDVPAHVRDSVGWIGTSLFPTMVHSLFKVESAAGEDVADVMRANSELYRFLTSIRDRRDRLSQLVRDCIPVLPDQPILYRGCYLAGTGKDSSTEQAFAPGVLRLLIKEQDNVSWTARALEQDATASQLARGLKIFLLCAITLGLLAIFGLIGGKFFFSKPDEAAG